MGRSRTTFYLLNAEGPLASANSCCCRAFVESKESFHAIRSIGRDRHDLLPNTCDVPRVLVTSTDAAAAHSPAAGLKFGGCVGPRGRPGVAIV
ncbi:hypothetical protein EVAR_93082_1 [Eumeta japonica]|uniref:Uncharacterized protein n=1 Tax=Eumeta variegata TaxID=151549 RepID=A0A4C1TG44_EUMVA|nr:hypothetical protein EVAR_93082_1 [Eumeta japonica]